MDRLPYLQVIQIRNHLALQKGQSLMLTLSRLQWPWTGFASPAVPIQSGINVSEALSKRVKLGQSQAHIICKSI